MKQRLIKSMKVSLEWRAIAFLITEVFFYATTGELWHATILALSLQLILFVTHFGWYFLRETHA
ncbi:MAG TPA: hypothetical protein VEB18_00805 [Candidatus Paceibacterota bacterium]|nr:hypothetical protein [Candidatus Paceibacterota bacterium]